MAIAQADYTNRSNINKDDNDNDETLMAMPRDYYPPPLRKPHMSLYYGTPEGCPSLETVEQNLYYSDNNNMASLLSPAAAIPHYSFQASRVAVWKTDPASTEGVSQWEELAVVDLPQI